MVVMSSGGWLMNGSAEPGSLVALLHEKKQSFYTRYHKHSFA